jgi:hypothetical protein
MLADIELPGVAAAVLGDEPLDVVAPAPALLFPCDYPNRHNFVQAASPVRRYQGSHRRPTT